MKTTVSVSIAKNLRALGTEHFFVLTGGDQSLWIALQEAGIRMILARSEFSAVYIADGYARASGKHAMTYGQAGPGAANVAAALADPFWAQSPVVALTGATASDATQKNECQSLEQMPLFAPVTKWSAHVPAPASAPELVSMAVLQALRGAQGPTHIDLPKDFFDCEIEDSPAPTGNIQAPTPAHPDAGAVAEIVDRLFAARKPVIVIGEGVVRARATEALLALVDALGIPVATTMGGKTALPADHPLNLGAMGRYSAKAANTTVAEADCVLVLGSRLGGLATNGYKVPAPTATVLQVDFDPSVFDVAYPAEVRLLADLGLAVPALAREVAGHSLSADASAWTTDVRSRITAWREGVRDATAQASTRAPLSPLPVLATLARHNRDITVVADTGYMAAWSGVLYPTVRPNSYFRAIGSLGWALPASLGVQMARSEKVVCITGDGGAGYHLGDIETAVRLRLPVIVLILNNQCLGFEYHEQKYRWGGRVVEEANNFSDADYAGVARALGAVGQRVDTQDAFEQAFAAALESERPTVIDVRIDRESFPPVTNFDATFKRQI